MPTATNSCDGCVSDCVIISRLFLCCCLQKFTKQQREIGTSVLLIWENVNFTTANFWNFFCRILKPSYIFCLGVLKLYTETNWMNSTSREIRRLNIKSIFSRRDLWRCYRCCLSRLLLFGQRASACTFDHLFVRLPSLCLEVCLSFVICLNISLPFIHCYCLSRIHPPFI